MIQVETSTVVAELEKARVAVRDLFTAHKGLLGELQVSCTHPEVYESVAGSGWHHQICPSCGMEARYYTTFVGESGEKLADLGVFEVDEEEFVETRKKFAPVIAA